MQRTYVWDPLVRLFHWALAVGFLADIFIIEGDARLHDLVGYIVMGLIGFRVIWGFIGPRYARFRSFPVSLTAAFAQLTDIANGRTKHYIGHSPLGALMIYNLLLSIFGVTVTGWMLTTDRFWGFEWVEELHLGLIIWAGFSVVVHIAAVIFESRRTGINLPASMLSGYKMVPEEGGSD